MYFTSFQIGILKNLVAAYSENLGENIFFTYSAFKQEYLAITTLQDVHFILKMQGFGI